MNEALRPKVIYRGSGLRGDEAILVWPRNRYYTWVTAATRRVTTNSQHLVRLGNGL
jgi:hypothetical protein